MFCPFCGEYYKKTEEAIPEKCQQCGYDLTSRPNASWMTVSFAGAIDEAADAKHIAFEGEELYRTWRQMALCSKNAKLFYAADENELSVCSFLGSVMANMRPFDPNNVPGYYTRLTFSQETTCEETNWRTGCCAWVTQLCRQGTFLLDELTPPERAAFIKWLFATEPHTSATGELKYDLSKWV